MQAVLYKEGPGHAEWKVWNNKFYDDEFLIACIQTTLIDKYKLHEAWNVVKIVEVI